MLMIVFQDVMWHASYTLFKEQSSSMLCPRNNQTNKSSVAKGRTRRSKLSVVCRQEITPMPKLVKGLKKV
jgi:hypothetical protein